jgi:glycosyltransferase involved in cell wall biosynthesis
VSAKVPAPVFSVTTPVFNGEHFIQRSYACLLAQSCGDWEWVVVDDGSTDATAERLRAIAALDPRVRIVTHAANQGRQGARESALEACRGDWLVVWDVDDLYFPDRLAVFARARERDYEFCCSYAVLVDNDLRIKGVRGFTPVPVAGRTFVHPGLGCRTDVARRIGYRSGPGKANIGEDNRLLLLLPLRHRGMWVDDTLTIYQEDREVTLRKALDANRGLLKVLQAIHGDRSLRSPLRARLRDIARLRGKLALLNLMQLYPRAYLWTVGRRSAGEKVEGWELGAEREQFVARLRAADFSVPPGELASVARELAAGLEFPDLTAPREPAPARAAEAH